MSRALCRLCFSPELDLHGLVRGSTLDRCSSCGFVQVRDQPTADQLRELYGSGYFARGKYDQELARQREIERRLLLLRRAGVTPGSRVLDAGCATGDFLAAGSGSYEMWGLDVSAAATEQARAANPELAARISTGFIEDQHFEHAFDAIVMWDVVEHLWDPRSVLTRLVEHLRPGGTLVLSTPDIGAPVARLMGSRWAFMTPPEHLGFFNQETLRFLLEQVLGLQTTCTEASGKWANLGFLAYKLRRVFPIVPLGLVERVRDSAFGTTAVYVPTADIRYVAARKRTASNQD
jgi:2-polyprenyl-3-methyl-5-hydroxy-6-metoxy-1,4-benzoquinol methylase